MLFLFMTTKKNQVKGKLRFLFSPHATKEHFKSASLAKRLPESKHVWLEHFSKPEDETRKSFRNVVELIKSGKAAVKPEALAGSDDIFRLLILKKLEGRKNLHVGLEKPSQGRSIDNILEAETTSLNLFFNNRFNENMTFLDREVKLFASEQAKREKGLIKQLKRVQRKKEGDTDIILGVLHTGVHHELKKKGVPTEYAIPKGGVLFSPHNEAVRRLLFNRPASEKRGKWLLGAAVPWQALTSYLKRNGFSEQEAHSEASKILKRVDFEDFKNLSKDVSSEMGGRQLTIIDAGEMTFSWLKKKGFVKPEEAV